MGVVFVKKLYPPIFIIVLILVTGFFIVLTEKYIQAELESRLDQEKMSLIREIFAQASFYTFDENTEIYTVYENRQRIIGYAFYGSARGYRGDIVIFVGLENREVIRNIVIIQQSEDYVYWERMIRQHFFDQFINLRIEDCTLEWWPGFGDGKVDNVSRSTVSSLGVVNAVRKAALEKIEYIN